MEVSTSISILGVYSKSTHRGPVESMDVRYTKTKRFIPAYGIDTRTKNCPRTCFVYLTSSNRNIDNERRVERNNYSFDFLPLTFCTASPERRKSGYFNSPNDPEPILQLAPSTTHESAVIAYQKNYFRNQTYQQEPVQTHSCHCPRTDTLKHLRYHEQSPGGPTAANERSPSSCRMGAIGPCPNFVSILAIKSTAEGGSSCYTPLYQQSVLGR